MTEVADIKLLPLPEWMSNYTIPTDGLGCGKDVLLEDRMHDYARVNIECVTAMLQVELVELRAENKRLVEALECMVIGACAVAVPHTGERAVLQEAVNIARATLAAYRKGSKQ